MSTGPEVGTEEAQGYQKQTRFGLPVHWKVLLVLYLTVFIDVLGFGIIFPLLPFYILELGGDAIWLGLITSSYSFFASLGSLVWGTASDKYGRKPFLLLGLFGVCIGQTGFGFSKALYLMVIARSFAGFCGGTESVAAAFVADLSTAEQRTKYMGHLGAASGLGFVIGPGLGGLLGPWLGFQGVAFVAAGMSAITVLLGIFLLKEPKRDAIAQKENFDWRSRANILTDRKYVFLFLSGWFLSFGWLAFDIAMPITGAVIYKMTEFQLGMVFMVFGIIYTLVLLMAPIFQRKLGEKKSALIASSFGSAILFGISYIPSMYGWIPLILLMAIGGGISDFCYPSLVSASSPPDRQGFVFGVYRGVGSAVRAVSPLVMGVLWDQNYHAPYLLAGALWIVSFIFLIFFKVPQGYTKVGGDISLEEIQMDMGSKFEIDEGDASREISDETQEGKVEEVPQA